MHDKKIILGQDSNQRPRAPRGNTITTELKGIPSNAVVRYCIKNQEEAILEGVVSCNSTSPLIILLLTESILGRKSIFYVKRDKWLFGQSRTSPHLTDKVRNKEKNE